MNEHPVGKLDLLSYLAGDTPLARTREIAAHLRTCSECAASLESLKQKQHTFLSRYPKAPLAREAVVKKGRILRFRASGQILALAACICIALSGTYLYVQQITHASYRLKGSTDLKIFVKTSDGTIATRSNNTFGPGEQIQFTYSCASENRFILISIDTSGAVTTFYPIAGDTSVTLQKGQGMPLPNSIILDSYLGPELYCAVFSRRPLSAAHVIERFTIARQAAGRLDNLNPELGDDVTVRTVLIVKKDTPP